MGADDDILFERRGRAGLVTLNRPKALNALSHDMVRRLYAQLRRWAADDRVERVIIRAVPGRGFCAGGDIRSLYEMRQAGDPGLRDFYFDEYRLNRDIRRFPKPYIALIDGIVMGGGVGVSVHGSHRIAGGNYLFAMPETGIGLFPDVGASYVLPRCPGETGMYLGLTGARLRSAGALAAGIATHAAMSDRFEELLDAVAGTDDLDGTIADFSAEPEGTSELNGITDRIDSAFSGDNVDAILDRLGRLGDPFGDRIRETLAAKSPTSLKITYRQLRTGRGLEIEDCMRLEARIVARVIEGHDLFEGIRAVVIDKDNAPAWQPPTLAEVTDDMVDAYFAPLDEELEFAD